MPFQKGQSGNPGGRRSKIPPELRAAARAHTAEAIATLVRHLRRPQSAVAAASELLDRGWGRPPQYLEHGGGLNITGGIDAPPRTPETREEWLARRRAELDALVATAGTADTRH